MTVTKNKNGNTLTLALEGRLDTNTALLLETEVDPAPEDVKELVLDFAKLEYISSAGLRVLLKAQKAMNKQGTMTVRNVCDDIKEVFDITGFSDILKVE